MTIKKLLTEQGYVAIKLSPMPTQHFEIDAVINGIEGRFILDTGASNTCLGLDSVSYFNIKTEVSEIKASGAGSSEIQASVSKRNTLRLGKWETKSTNIVVLDLQHVNYALEQHNIPPIHGIIGADILKKGKAIIDYPKRTLYLK